MTGIIYAYRRMGCTMGSVPGVTDWCIPMCFVLLAADAACHARECTCWSCGMLLFTCKWCTLMFMFNTASRV